jgi:GTPase SAR1 family protein
MEIEKFDPSRMKKPVKILIVGKRGSGRTTLIKDLVEKLSFVDYVYDDLCMKREMIELVPLYNDPKLSIITSVCYHFTFLYREYIDCTFFFKEYLICNKKKIYDYIGYNGKFSEFMELFDRLTQDYGCMVVDKEKHIYHYKANE